jgi:hypothetical protein
MHMTPLLLLLLLLLLLAMYTDPCCTWYLSELNAVWHTQAMFAQY